MKTLATIAAAAMLCCAGAAQAEGAGASRLDDVLARGTLRVCTTGDYKPYSYYRTDGRFEGIDIDMAESLAKSLGVKPDYVKTSWSNLTADFVAKCDIAVGGVSTTLERQKRAFFTQPYVVDGKTERFAKQYFTHATLTVYPDNVTIFKQILAGKADVMVTDASETLLQQKLNPGLCSVHPDKPFQFGEKAYMVPRGDVVFQQYVDQWLHLALSTGEYQAISDKWLK